MENKTPMALQRAAKQRQLLIGLLAAAMVVAVLFGIIFLHRHRARAHPPHKAFTSAFEQDFTDSAVGTSLTAEQRDVDALTREVSALKDALKASQARQADARADQAHLKTVVDTLNTRLHSVEHQPSLSPTQSTAPIHHPPLTKTVSSPVPPIAQTRPSSLPSWQGRVSGDGMRTSTAIQQTTLHFDYQASVITPDHTPDNYVPTGTFARAVLLQGADANASVDGAKNTSPILLRLTTNGTLPNGAHSHLKGCFVLASIYGDISSERGEVRLTRLSCTRDKTGILDQPVKGYVAFYGKEGIKGRPVMRNGKIIFWAGTSGLLSGFGKAVEQAQTTQSISPLGVTQTIDPARTAQYGLASGAGTALDKLSEYYIKRADQYHPIIEIGAGNPVTVVFTSGFSLQKDGKPSKTAAIASPMTDSPPSWQGVVSPEQALKQKLPPKLYQQLLAQSHLGQTVPTTGGH